MKIIRKYLRAFLIEAFDHKRECNLIELINDTAKQITDDVIDKITLLTSDELEQQEELIKRIKRELINDGELLLEDDNS